MEHCLEKLQNLIHWWFSRRDYIANHLKWFRDRKYYICAGFAMVTHTNIPSIPFYLSWRPPLGASWKVQEVLKQALHHQKRLFSLTPISLRLAYSLLLCHKVFLSVLKLRIFYILISLLTIYKKLLV